MPDKHVQADKVTSAIMYYMISSLNGVLGKTHLQKLLFLSDLLSSKKFGEPVTNMKYIRYTHGPYSKDLDEYILTLTSKDLIEEKQFPMLSDLSKHYSRFYVRKIIKIKDYISEKIGPDRMLLVDEVVQSYGNKSLQEVLDFVYGLEEVSGAQFESPITIAIDKHQPGDSSSAEDIPF